MKAVWKFQLDLVQVQTLSLPEGAKVLDACVQREHLCLWMLVDPEATKVARTYHLFGTGYEIPDRTAGHYVATYHLDSGFVFHLFESGEKDEYIQ